VVWSKECVESFQELKKRLTTILVLALPSGTKGFVIYSDASNKGFGYALMQHGRVISYTPKQLNLYKINYHCA
jgi:hypothetical protein